MPPGAAPAPVRAPQRSTGAMLNKGSPPHAEPPAAAPPARRAWFWLVVPLVLLPVLGFAYEALTAAYDTWRYPPPGRLVAIDGHRMHVNCTGAGRPTVVMDAGLGGWSLDWSLVQPEIA